ncbi:MAG: MucR family transcriptional regulator [Alphaproteobacteria bacterium]|nr:MucR family transcriptional regulator [Alphaproteobacteria bacterium]
MSMNNDQQRSLKHMAVDIVSAYVSHNRVGTEELPALIRSVFESLSRQSPEAAASENLVPAVAVRSSVTRDRIICLEDGRSFKSLKRHLRTAHGFTPAQYRARWSLRSDYPLVAPAYAAQRSDLAKQIGLGRKPGETRGGRRKGSKRGD